MKSGSCIYPGCPYSIYSGEFCENHQPHKPIVEKSDKCRFCGRVLGVETRVVGGVCYACYQKPEAKAARKKVTAAKKDTRGTCSTPGCGNVNDRGRGKCGNCLSPKKCSTPGCGGISAMGRSKCGPCLNPKKSK
jgi:hypothetical protein